MSAIFTPATGTQLFFLAKIAKDAKIGRDGVHAVRIFPVVIEEDDPPLSSVAEDGDPPIPPWILSTM